MKILMKQLDHGCITLSMKSKMLIINFQCLDSKTIGRKDHMFYKCLVHYVYL